ncbi:MAG: sensor histidine kinase [Bacteroidota bacterium]
MKKQPAFLFYLLGTYVIVQFSWWAYHIIQLTREIGYGQAAVNKRIGMIIGEGLVFFLILIFGLWRIIRSIKKEHELAKRQHNFLLSVTHELKTPLASTKLYLQTLLKRNFEAEKREEMLQKALTENKRLEEIVDAILISARIENRTLEIHRERINLNDETEQILHDFRLKFPQAKLRFEAKNEVSIQSDLFMIRTIIYNLVGNAIKYAGTDEEISVVLSRQENQVVLQVKDFGPGISPDKQHIIFEKFIRLENEETRSKKGTGLGLFIVKEFTSLCGGTITCKNNQPKGSVFEVRL